jgi:uncharacterized membrane protein
MRSWLSVLVVVAACGNDVRGDQMSGDDDPVEPDTCETSYLAYDNFGAPFVVNWCRGCHSSTVPKNMRQNAPLDVNFDTVADVTHWAERIKVRAAGATPTMPPAGGPSADERQLLAEWIACGMK